LDDERHVRDFLVERPSSAASFHARRRLRRDRREDDEGLVIEASRFQLLEKSSERVVRIGDLGIMDINGLVGLFGLVPVEFG
jgi:hypothetical protein